MSTTQDSQTTLKPNLAWIFLSVRANWNINVCPWTPCTALCPSFFETDVMYTEGGQNANFESKKNRNLHFKKNYKYAFLFWNQKSQLRTYFWGRQAYFSWNLSNSALKTDFGLVRPKQSHIDILWYNEWRLYLVVAIVRVNAAKRLLCLSSHTSPIICIWRPLHSKCA